MMYATEEEGGSRGAAYTQTFPSEAATEFFLAVYAAREGFPGAERFL